MRISDERLDYLADIFIQKEYRKNHGWTFTHFLDMVNRGTIKITGV